MFNYSGLPHGQEKSGITMKNYKSPVKMGVFKKSQEKKTHFVSSNLANSLYF